MFRAYLPLSVFFLSGALLSIYGCSSEDSSSTGSATGAIGGQATGGMTATGGTQASMPGSAGAPAMPNEPDPIVTPVAGGGSPSGGSSGEEPSGGMGPGASTGGAPNPPPATGGAAGEAPDPEEPNKPPVTPPPAGTIGDGTCPVQLVGWATEGKGTTGGGDASPQMVNTFSELQKLAGDGQPRVIYLSGTVKGTLNISSNKTIIGADKNATIEGGVEIRSQSNIIVQNLSVVGALVDGVSGPSDTIMIRGSNHIWLDHLNASDGPDGVIDITRGSDHCTISWSKIWYTKPNHGHKLALLFGGGSTHGDTDRGKNNHTVHHMWFAEEVDQRMPRLLFGRGHMFNNYFNSPGNTYCIGSGSWSSLYVENNYFKDVNDSHRFQDGNPSYIEAVGNIYDNTKGKKDTGLGGKGDNPPGPWVPSSVYDYKGALHPAEMVPEIVQRCAGPQ